MATGFVLAFLCLFFLARFTWRVKCCIPERKWGGINDIYMWALSTLLLFYMATTYWLRKKASFLWEGETEAISRAGSIVACSFFSSSFSLSSVQRKFSPRSHAVFQSPNHGLKQSLLILRDALLLCGAPWVSCVFFVCKWDPLFSSVFFYMLYNSCWGSIRYWCPSSLAWDQPSGGFPRGCSPRDPGDHTRIGRRTVCQQFSGWCSCHSNT